MWLDSHYVVRWCCEPLKRPRAQRRQSPRAQRRQSPRAQPSQNPRVQPRHLPTMIVGPGYLIPVGSVLPILLEDFRYPNTFINLPLKKHNQQQTLRSTTRAKKVKLGLQTSFCCLSPVRCGFFSNMASKGSDFQSLHAGCFWIDSTWLPPVQFAWYLVNHS